MWHNPNPVPRVVSCMLLFLAMLWSPASAAPITLVAGTVNMFRETRGLNDVGGAPQGDVLQYGADITGGSAGTSLGATHPSGFADPPVICGPLAANPNFCANETPFDGSALTPWTLHFTNGADRLDVIGPPVVGAESPAPFPASVRFSGSSATPTISWEPPAGFTPDGFRINIFDRGDRLPNGAANIVHSVTIPPTMRSYAIPANLSSGRTLVEGQPYSIGLQLIETRGHVRFSGNNAQILRRSNSFFSFVPRSAPLPADVHLPMVGIDPDPTDDRGAPHIFNIDSVAPERMTFVDASLAIGYIYEIGVGNPSFASVLLPNVGDGAYEVVVDGVPTSVRADEQFFFRQGGVSSFTVLGVELPAGPDSGGLATFVTGLTFAERGAFTGTITPIVVPAPDSAAGEPEP